LLCLPKSIWDLTLRQDFRLTYVSNTGISGFGDTNCSE
jgi:hypothetical protein